MSVSVEFTIRPWLVPNFVTVERPPGGRQGGIAPLPSIHISELTPATLEAQLIRFCTDVRARAATPYKHKAKHHDHSATFRRSRNRHTVEVHLHVHRCEQMPDLWSAGRHALQVVVREGRPVSCDADEGRPQTSRYAH